MMSRVLLVASSFMGLSLLLVACDAAAQNSWVLAGSGNWSDPLNWSQGLPTKGSDAYIANGGTALVTGNVVGPSRLFLGGNMPGSVEIVSGNFTSGGVVLFVAPEALPVMGDESSSAMITLPVAVPVSKFTIGGTASAELQSFGGSNQFVEQTGGSLKLNTLGLSGDHVMTGGELLVTYEFATFADSLFQLVDGDVDVAANRVTLRGDYLQQGGTFAVAYESTIRGGAIVRIEGGVADFKNTELLQGGRMELAGGTLMVAKPLLPAATGSFPAGELQVSGGTLALTNGVSSGSAPMTFDAGSWSLDVRAGIANIANARMPDVSQAHLVLAPETLTILPQGIMPADFASATVNGVVHTAGSVLTLPAGKTVRGMGTIDDPLVVGGQLIAYDATPSSSANPSIRALNGIRVLENAVARLGNGQVIITDQTSGLFGGELRADEVFVGQPGKAGRFEMTGGLLTDGNTSTSAPEFYVGHQVGSVGQVLMSAGTLEASYLWIGLNGQGTFTQTGGDISLRYTSGSAPIIGRGGHYQLDGGSLRAAELNLAGSFTQMGGSHQTNTYADVGSQPEEGLYQLLGGTHTIGSLSIGRFRNSNGRYRVDETGELIVDRLTMFGEGHGILEIDGGKVSIATASVGDYGPSFELRLDSAEADVRILNSLKLGPSAKLSVVPNAAIHLGGNLSITSGDSAKLSHLNNLKIVIANQPGKKSVVEVAGRDVGEEQAGFVDNFALQTLQIGDAIPGMVRLDDLFDNQPQTAGSEALYVRDLIVGPKSTLDLNGYKLYYTNLALAPDATVLLNGGMLIHVPIPEPTSLYLAAALLVGVALGRCRRFTWVHVT